MSDRLNLLIDLGNTSIKYVFVSPELNIMTAPKLKASFANVSDLPKLIKHANACYFCSVKNDQLALDIMALCEKAKIPCKQAKSAKQQFGLRNAYQNVQNMGADRWMAIMAASFLSKAKGFDNVLVIDAGTAMTCDFIIGHQHVGGWIAPGLTLLRESVVSRTERVFDDHASPTHLTPGTDTPLCVAQGALAQTLGFVAQAKVVMSNYCDDFECIVSGGDASLISQAGMSGLSVYANIVLIGLSLIAADAD